MKALEWHAAQQRLRERLTGRVLSGTSPPVDIEDGDLFIDTDAPLATEEMTWLQLYGRTLLLTEIGP